MLGSIALALLLAGGPSLPFEVRESFGARVVRIVDGDTLRVLRDHTQVKIRVEGIEHSGARAGLRESRAGVHIAACPPARRDGLRQGQGARRRGRLVARVFVGDVDLSHELVRAGLAWHYKTYSPDATLAREEEEAREARRGLWADKDPVPPWEWRR